MKQQNIIWPTLTLATISILVVLLGSTAVFNVPSHVLRLFFLSFALPLLWATWVWQTDKHQLLFNGMLVPFIILIPASILSGIFAYDTFEPWITAIKWTLLLGNIWFVFNIFRKQWQQMHLLLWAIVISALLTALIGLAQFWLGSKAYLAQGASSSFGHPNMAAQYVIMSLPAIWILSLQQNSKRTITTLLFMAVLMIAFIFTSGARQALVALILQLIVLTIGLLTLYLQGEKILHITKSTIAASVGIIALAFVIALIPAKGQSWSIENTGIAKLSEKTQRLESGDLRAISSNRLNTWIPTLAMGKDYWLHGVGIDNWRVHFPKYQISETSRGNNLGHGFWEELHNDYLQFFMEIGIVSIVMMALFLWGLVTTIRRIIKLGDTTAKIYCLGIITALSGLFVVMMFSFPLQRMAQSYLLSCYIGMLLAIDHASKRSKTIECKNHIGLAAALVVVTFLITGLLSNISEGWHHTLRNVSYSTYLFNKPNITYKERKQSLAMMNKAMDFAGSNPRANMKICSNAIGIHHKTNDKRFLPIAEQSCQKAIEVYAFRSFLLSNYALLLGKVNRNEEAFTNVLKATTYDPWVANFTVNLSLRMDKMKSIPATQIEQALTNMETAFIYNQKKYLAKNYLKQAKRFGYKDRALAFLSQWHQENTTHELATYIKQLAK